MGGAIVEMCNVEVCAVMNSADGVLHHEYIYKGLLVIMLFTLSQPP